MQPEGAHAKYLAGVLRLVRRHPIALFRETKLTNSSGIKLEPILHAKLVCFLLKKNYQPGGIMI